MGEKKIGRPPMKPPLSECLTPKQAVNFIRDELVRMSNDNKEIVKKKSKSLGTIYNYISAGKLTNFGDRECALLSIKEIRAKILKIA